MDDRKLLLDRLREHSSRGPTELLRDHRDWLGPCKLPEPIEVVVAPRLLPARHVSWSRYTSPAPDSDCNCLSHEMQPIQMCRPRQGVFRHTSAFWHKLHLSPSLIEARMNGWVSACGHFTTHSPLRCPSGSIRARKDSTYRICENAELGRKAPRNRSVMLGFQIARKFVKIDHHVRCNGATKCHRTCQNLRSIVLTQ